MSWVGEDGVQDSPTHLPEEAVGASTQGSPPSASGGGASTQASPPSAMRWGGGEEAAHRVDLSFCQMPFEVRTLLFGRLGLRAGISVHVYPHPC